MFDKVSNSDYYCTDSSLSHVGFELSRVIFTAASKLLLVFTYLNLVDTFTFGIKL